MSEYSYPGPAMSREPVRQDLWIPGPLPGLNEILDARGIVMKTKDGVARRHDGYSKMKRTWSERIALYARQQGFATVTGAAHFWYNIAEPNRRRDPSNFVAGAVKLIEDALQDAGLLKNDGWEHVLSIKTEWRLVPDRPGVMLTVIAGGT